MLVAGGYWLARNQVARGFGAGVSCLLVFLAFLRPKVSGLMGKSLRGARALLLFITACCAPFAWAQSPTPVDFNKSIRPILAYRCMACHGPDSVSRKAGLRFDREEGFFGPKNGQGEGEPAVVRGKPEASPLYQRITSTDADTVMPPPDAVRRLTAAEIDGLVAYLAKQTARIAAN